MLLGVRQSFAGIETPPALNGIMSKAFQKRGGLVTCADAGPRGCTE